MRTWDDTDTLFEEEEETQGKKSWKNEFNQRAKAIMDEKNKGECLVLSFNTANSENLRQDYGVMVRYLQNLFKTGHLSFKRFGLVFWDDSDAKAFGPYPFNSNRNVRSFIFNKMQMIMKKKKKEDNHDTQKIASYDYALCPFFKNSSTDAEAEGQLSAFRQKVSMIIVFTGSELEDPADPVARAWARRMRDRTIYILKQGTRGKAKDFKKYDPDWQKHYVLIPKGGSPKNEDLDLFDDFDGEECSYPEYDRFDEYFGFSDIGTEKETSSVNEFYEKGFNDGFKAYQRIAGKNENHRNFSRAFSGETGLNEAADPNVSDVVSNMMSNLGKLREDDRALMDKLKKLKNVDAKDIKNLDIAKMRDLISKMRFALEDMFYMTDDLTDILMKQAGV